MWKMVSWMRTLAHVTIFLVFRAFELRLGVYSMIRYGNPFGYYLARTLPDTYFLVLLPFHGYEYVMQTRCPESEYPNAKMLILHCVLMAVEIAYRYEHDALSMPLYYAIGMLIGHILSATTVPIQRRGLYMQVMFIAGICIFYAEFREAVRVHVKGQELGDTGADWEVGNTGRQASDGYVFALYLPYLLFSV